MAMFSLREAAALVSGSIVLGDDSVRFERLSTDSRSVGAGDLFVALKGERFDAHDFLPDMAARDVTAVLVTHVPDNWTVPTLQVNDTRVAFGELARGWRQKFDIPLVAVTGSNGKTTVKEMIASIFAAEVGADACLATAGNFNNDIGVPMTLFRLHAGHRLAVVEIGMNHPGETPPLARMAAPGVVVVNNAQREHQEFMLSVEAVAHEHASAIRALSSTETSAGGAAQGVAVFPADDRYTEIWRAAAIGKRVVDFALSGVSCVADAAVKGTLDGNRLDIETPQARIEVTLQVIGEHNARNALAATSAALAAGVSLDAIRRGLESFGSVKGRLHLGTATLGTLAGATVIDDTYNANPDSMRAAIDVLASYASPRVLIMGDMAEVGDSGPEFHREIGAYARSCGVDALFAVGDASRDSCVGYGAQARHAANIGTLITQLQEAGLGASATFLIKGSRFMRMERVVDAMTHS